jgi:hypothetical protein
MVPAPRRLPPLADGDLPPPPPPLLLADDFPPALRVAVAMAFTSLGFA